MHAMSTHHGGRGHPVDRDIDLHTEEAEATGIANDNQSVNGSDTTVALGGLEVTLINFYPATRPS